MRSVALRLRRWLGPLALVLATGIVPAGAYVEGPVADGGSLTGRVRFAGEPVAGEPLTVRKDRQVCGETKPFQALVVGPDKGVRNTVVYLEGVERGKRATDFELVSISLDPEYDTPGVLREYAEARGLDTSNWSFLTGPDAAVRHLLAQLGVIREFEGATIKHTLATVLIDSQGRIIHRVDGSTWQVEDFVRRLKKR